MKRTLHLCIIVTFLAAAGKMPAPVTEESTPRPTPRAKPKPSATEHKQSAPKKYVSPFAGTWQGRATWACSDSHKPSSWDIALIFSSDARIVRVNWTTDTGEKAFASGPLAANCIVSGNEARWNMEATGNNKQNHFAYSMALQLLKDRSAMLSFHIVATVGEAGGTCDGSGTLTRR